VVHGHYHSPTELCLPWSNSSSTLVLFGVIVVVAAVVVVVAAETDTAVADVALPSSLRYVANSHLE